MINISNLINKQIILTPENQPEIILIKITKGSIEFIA